MKKILSIMLILILLASTFIGCSKPGEQTEETKVKQNKSEQSNATKEQFPTKNISGIVQWGAGGGTDSLMRPLASLTEKNLGISIIVENKTGGTGSIATQYVHDSDADGYTLLMGAENPQLYTMLDIIDLTYEDFEPVFLIGDETVGIVVEKDSKYKSFTDLINAAKENPGEINIATTGTGGLPWSVASFINSVTGATFNQIPYDSDASARTAVISGETDFTVAKIQSGLEAHKAGDIKYISMFSKGKVLGLEDIPSITEEYPEFNEFLPWGPFYGVFVKDGTDQAVIDTLSSAFKKAFNEPSYQEILENFNINPLGYTGEQAKEYLKKWQLNTAESLYKSGAITKSPEELGIK